MNRFSNARILAVLGVVLICWSCTEPGSDKQNSGNQVAEVAKERAAGQYRAIDRYPGLTFTRPVHILSVPGTDSTAAVITQEGQLSVIDGVGSNARSWVALDISSRVLQAGNEEGLLGIAFSPDFVDSGKVFLYSSRSNPRRTVLSQFIRKKQSANLIEFDPESEQVLLKIPQPYSNHNGGHIEFGADGYLYIGVGDGGSAGDPNNNGQNLSTLLGSLLRIDPSSSSASIRYQIPPDNPFQLAGQRPEIFAFGLRNPWRFSIDSKTQEIWLADVGQNRFEEINLIQKGGNYGWRVLEATHCFNPPEGCPKEGLIMPLYEYGRDQGVSVTGGVVYRGEKIEELKGRYIFADFVSGRVWGLTKSDSGNYSAEQILKLGTYISSIGMDAEGEILFTAFDGKVYLLEKNT